MKGLGRLIRATIVLGVSLPFVGALFRITSDDFWTKGLGDWIDPYFINYLLEHWRHSLLTLSSPASPPMFFPAPRTLGYSHGLVLFAPFYLAARLFLHPFQADSLALLLVIETGILCLYVFFRKILSLSFVESILLTVFFFTSQNVVNGFIGVWSQRASVFLVPPILLLVFTSARMPPGPLRMLCAALAGLLSTLMFTQDFYSALFALLFAVLGIVPAVMFSPSLRERAAGVWKGQPSSAARLALAISVTLTVWTVFVLLTGGVAFKILGLRIQSRDWFRPAILASVALAAFAWLRGGVNARRPFDAWRPWWLSFMLGAVAGAAIFFTIYLDSYREHPAFAASELTSSLIQRGWNDLRPGRPFFGGFETLRTFQVVFALGLLALVPGLGASARIRWYCAWALLVSAAVIVAPLRIGEFSIWMTVFAQLPGFAVVRDLRRIAYLYELAAVIATAAFLARLPGRSPLRIAGGVIILAAVLLERNPTRLDFVRSNESYDRWVAAPIAVDPSCKSFFIRRASPAYEARSADVTPMYAIDAMFAALRTSIPTLNGYSAWDPAGWALRDPAGPGYAEGVRLWVDRHHLAGVCELDLDRRTMTLWNGRS